jgi:hypothetical protein
MMITTGEQEKRPVVAGNEETFSSLPDREPMGKASKLSASVSGGLLWNWM